MLHQPLYNIDDLGFSGLSKFSELLSVDNIQVQELYDLHELEAIPATSSCLLIGPYTSKNNNSLISNHLDDYIKKGGMVLVLGEHDNLAKLNTHQNEIIKPYGLQFSTEAWSNSELWPIAKSTINSLETRLYYPTTVSGGKTLLKFQKYSLACSKTIEKGTVVAIGDAEWLWNMNSVHGIQENDNYLFFKFLLQIKTPSRHSHPNAILRKLISDYKDLNFSLNPRKISKTHKKHMIVFSPNTYLGNHSNQEGLVKAVRKMKFFDHLTYTIPNELKSLISLNKGILAEEKQQAKISFNLLKNNSLTLHSSPLIIKGHNDLSVLLKSKKNITHFFNLIPTVSEVSSVTFNAKSKITQPSWPLIMKNNKYFIFTSKSLISDTFFKTSKGEQILKHVETWAKN